MSQTATTTAFNTTEFAQRIVTRANSEITASGEAMSAAPNLGADYTADDLRNALTTRTELAASVKVCRTAMSVASFIARNADEFTIASAQLAIMSELIDLATDGADDTWSGRGNDDARIANDAKLATIRMIRDWVSA